MAILKTVFGGQAKTTPTRQEPIWVWFRRLFLGTVIEAFLETGISVRFSSLTIRFGDDSRFQVPRIDNYMRFTGTVEAVLSVDVDADAVDRLEETLREAWPSLVAVIDIPVGDRLTSERNDIRVTVEGACIRVHYDLVAD